MFRDSSATCRCLTKCLGIKHRANFIFFIGLHSHIHTQEILMKFVQSRMGLINSTHRAMQTRVIHIDNKDSRQLG